MLRYIAKVSAAGMNTVFFLVMSDAYFSIFFIGNNSLFLLEKESRYVYM